MFAKNLNLYTGILKKIYMFPVFFLFIWLQLYKGPEINFICYSVSVR